MGVSVDILENPIAMDLTTNAGFALALLQVSKLKRGGVCIIAICCRSYSVMCLAYMMYVACSALSLPRVRMTAVAYA